MELVGCTAQGDWYRVYYADLSADSDPLARACGTAMLELLSALARAPWPGRVYLLTSMSTLCLLSQDSYEPEGWHVRIEPPWEGVFIIEFDPPGSKTPVAVTAVTPDEAVEKVLAGMRASGGWAGHPGS